MSEAKSAQIALHREHAYAYNIARRYYPATKAVNAAWNAEIVDWLPIRSGLIVLDNMCGTGVLCEDLARDARVSEVHAADISAHMLNYVTYTEKLMSVAPCDADALLFPDKSFDVVIVRGALHHVNPCDHALAEMHRVLKPFGTLILSEPCQDFCVVRWARTAMYRALPYFDVNEHPFTSYELKCAVSRAGFVVRRQKRFGFFAYALFGFPDIVPALGWLQRIPGMECLARWCIALDRVLARLPIIQRWSFVYFLEAQKCLPDPLSDEWNEWNCQKNS